MCLRVSAIGFRTWGFSRRASALGLRSWGFGLMVPASAKAKKVCWPWPRTRFGFRVPFRVPCRFPFRVRLRFRLGFR